MATVDVGANSFVTWDKTVPIVVAATVTGASGTVTYTWSFTSRPVGSSATLIGGGASVSFYSDVPGAYVVNCAITNTTGSSSDSVTLTVRPTHWVRASGSKIPATMRAKVTPVSVVSSTVEATV